MKFVLCLFPVYAFIVGSGSLYISPGHLEHPSRELARPNMPSMSADIADKTRSWPSRVVGPRVQNLATLAKRTTDEESPNSQEDIIHRTNARNGPVIYTAEQLATYREQYFAARRASTNFGNKVKRARGAGREVSQADVDELSRLTAVTNQRRLVFTRASQRKPLDHWTTVARRDVAALALDPEIQELAKSGDYSALQLAAYKRSFLDAGTEFRAMKDRLAKVSRVRKVTQAEEEELADLRLAFNLQRTIWNRVRQAKPADYRVDRLKKSMDDLLQSAKLHEIAQSSGYSVRELAEAQRRYLDSINTANAFKRELAEVEKVRAVTAEETTHLQTLRRATTKLKRVFHRMCQGRPADGGDFIPRKDVPSLLNDPEMQQIAQRGGYSVEEVAVQRRAYLDAWSQYATARKTISAVKKAGGTLAPDVADGFLEIHRAYFVQKHLWDRMQKESRPGPGSQEQASPASQAKKEDPSLHPPPPPLQISGPRHLLAPVLSSARRWLRGLGGPWRAMPWPRYLANPRRLNNIKPAELLRAEAEHAL
ncbi:MAG: hypothetical protein M1826_005487 [Phylliscum demangeonii]|nr:MAG: hypothetical protein M1826_005487 [Phylliscum demangeonii]